MRRTCAELGCRNTSTSTRCPQHTRAREQGRAKRQPYRAGYRDKRYREARLVALKLAGYRCTRILHPGRRCTQRAVEVHHIKPLSQGGDAADPRNLAPVCREHNPRGGAR